MPTPHVVVVGGGYAGRMALSRIRAGVSDARITLVEPRADWVERIQLHMGAARGDRVTRSLAPLCDRLGVTHVRGVATALNTEGRGLDVETPRGLVTVPWDRLLLTCGSRVRAAAPGVADHAVCLDGPEDAHALRRLLSEAPEGHRVAVVGAGHTALEVATALAVAHPAHVVFLVAPRAPGGDLSDGARTRMLRRLDELGISHRRVAVQAVEPGRLQTADGPILADRVVWCAGFEPTPFARTAGLPVDSAGRMRVDAWLRVTGLKGVFAAGDAARIPGPGGEPLRMACATAMPSGAWAGDQIARQLRGEALQPFRFRYVGRCLQLGEGMAMYQWTDPIDRPRRRATHGLLARLLRRAIVAMTRWMPRIEARLARRIMPIATLRDRAAQEESHVR